ncbi:MAG: hypothetical protein MUF54_24685, partial [Polyangiaceae bacterium]|nr:hypothetical protein [Polyangiaceae bacterium]
AQIEAATKNPISLGNIHIDGMSKADRLFIYAVACWLARIDGRVTESERDALDKLGMTLSIPERPRQHAERIACDVASLPDGDRPAFYDLTKLKHIINERLEQARRLRATDNPE